MIWLTPWAWLGLAAIAVPIVVHLIGRRRPTHLAFPTLRFLPETRLAIRPRRRIHDPWLLALRIAIVTAAVAALAGPRLFFGRASATVARAIVVDISTSMSRPTVDGREARTDARERAERLASEAQTSEIVEAGHLPSGLDDALGWLGRQEGRRELVVISDFQAGAITEIDAGRVPAAYGFRIERVRMPPAGRVAAGAVHLGDAVVDVSLDLDPTATTASWTERAAEGVRVPVELIEPVPEAWKAAARAATTMGAAAGPATRQIRVAATVPAGPPTPAAPWMFAAIEAAHRAWGAAPDEADRLRFAITSPSALVAVVDPSTDALRVARLLRALAQAAVDRPPVAELETAEIPEATTQAWAREPGAPAGRGTDSDASDARWVWAVVLILLGVEWLVRRHRTDESAGKFEPASEEQSGHARVA
jgi:hypothetical protein